jgi:hypothetical protein
LQEDVPAIRIDLMAHTTITGWSRQPSCGGAEKMLR